MKDLFDSIPDETKHAFDIISLLGTLGALVSLLPAISAFLSCVWLGLRIYETKTVQGWLGKND